MKYKDLIEGEWYKFIRKDGGILYCKYKHRYYVNTTKGTVFFNEYLADITNSDYHYKIEFMSGIEINWIKYCYKKKLKLTFKEYLKIIYKIDNYSII